MAACLASARSHGTEKCASLVQVLSFTKLLVQVGWGCSAAEVRYNLPVPVVPPVWFPILACYMDTRYSNPIGKNRFFRTQFVLVKPLVCMLGILTSADATDFIITALFM